MKAFTEHPKSVGESYLQHMATSFRFGGRMMLAGVGCLLHGFFPFLCKTTGSQAISTLHHNMVTHRDKRVPCPKTQRQKAA
ncbi:MAG: DUF6356 family protein [Maricaulaceae bacterium]